MSTFEYISPYMGNKCKWKIIMTSLKFEQFFYLFTLANFHFRSIQFSVLSVVRSGVWLCFVFFKVVFLSDVRKIPSSTWQHVCCSISYLFVSLTGVVRVVDYKLS